MLNVETRKNKIIVYLNKRLLAKNLKSISNNKEVFLEVNITNMEVLELTISRLSHEKYLIEDILTGKVQNSISLKQVFIFIEEQIKALVTDNNLKCKFVFTSTENKFLITEVVNGDLKSEIIVKSFNAINAMRIFLNTKTNINTGLMKDKYDSGNGLNCVQISKKFFKSLKKEGVKIIS